MAEVIKSVRRVAEILEEFDRVRRPLSLKDICDHLGYASSSGAAMLKSLAALGYLAYDRRTRTYLPTMRIVVFGEWVPQEIFSRHNILAALETLCRQSGLHAFVATQSDLCAQYVHVIGSDSESMSLTLKSGALVPIARSGVGRMLLSALPDADVERTIRRVNYFERNPDRRVDLQDLLTELGHIRARGYSFGRSLLTPGVGTLTKLIPAEVFSRMLVIGVGGDVDHVEGRLESHLGALNDAVAAIDRAS